MNAPNPQQQTPADILTPRQKGLALVGVLLGMLLAALDNTIVSTAGPTMQRELKIEPGLYVWITTSYLVSSTVLVPIWGKLSDILGRRRVLLAGIFIFLGGSVLCGFAESATQLILYRAIQGIGSASLFTSAFAIVGDLFSPRERGRLNGFFGAVFGLSSVIGPLVGGFITDNFGWHWCFFVNAPVGALAIVFIFMMMPPLLPQDPKRHNIDVAGAIALSVGVVPLLVGLSLGKAQLRAGETGFLWLSWQEGAFFGTALVGIVLFLFIEGRARDPIVDLKLFKNRAYALGTAAAFAAGLTFLGAVVFLPFFMQNVVGEKATGAGLTTVPLTFGIVFSNITSGIATSRTGKYKPFIMASLALSIVAFAILAFTLTPEATKLNTSWKMFLIGMGIGPAIPLFALAIQNSVPPQFIGVASSMATFSRQMGAVIGIAIMSSVFATTLSTEMESKVAEATKDVPPGMLEEMKKQQAGGSGAAASDDDSPGQIVIDKEKVTHQIHETFAKQRELVVKALRDNDAAAVAALQANPQTPEQMKKVLAAGGIAAQVQAGFDATFARVKAAVEAGPDAVAALAADPSIPPPLAEKLKQIPPPALASPEARAGILAGVQQGMNAAADQAKKKALDAAITGATEGLTSAENTAVATVAHVERGMKEAVTDAVTSVYKVAILLAILALLASLPMPALPLRQQGGGGPPAGAD